MDFIKDKKKYEQFSSPKSQFSLQNTLKPDF